MRNLGCFTVIALVFFFVLSTHRWKFFNWFGRENDHSWWSLRDEFRQKDGKMVRTRILLAGLRRYFGAPVDAASLVFLRVCFGLILFWEVTRYFDRGWISKYWMEPEFHFHYFGFGWVHPWPGEGMYWHFAGMGLLSLLIAFGLFYRLSAWLMFFAFTYVYLLEQARYLNHFYLVCLVAFLMALSPAHCLGSLDVRWGLRRREETIARWYLWLLRFQIGVVYFFGGVAKLNADWLMGEPLRSWLAARADFPLVGPWFEREWVVAVMNYGGLLFDLFVVPAVLWSRTRALGFAGVIFFNLTNATLFSIGIFPFLAIAFSTVFFDPSWPRRVFVFCRASDDRGVPVGSTSPIASQFVVAFVSVYVAWQLFLPLRHWLYPGNVSWTEEGHDYAWHMKLRTKSSRIQFIVRERDQGREITVRPSKYLESWQASKMANRPDMILQFASFLSERMREDGWRNFGIFVDTAVSLNGRARQPLIDPRVDLLSQERSLWPKDWLVPLKVPLPVRDDRR